MVDKVLRVCDGRKMYWRATEEVCTDVGTVMPAPRWPFLSIAACWMEQQRILEFFFTIISCSATIGIILPITHHQCLPACGATVRGPRAQKSGKRDQWLRPDWRTWLQHYAKFRHNCTSFDLNPHYERTRRSKTFAESRLDSPNTPQHADNSMG